MTMRMSARLRALFDLVPSDYDVAWDLCCDHGFLGEALLRSGKTRSVHFVDQVPGIMAQLQGRLGDEAGCHFHTRQAESLQPVIGDRQLVVLAGVGGEKSEWILEALMRYAEFRRADWLLAPANDAMAVRQWLARAGFGLQAQALCTERGWCYDLLRVSLSVPDAVPDLNPDWDPTNPAHRRQILKWRRHFINQLSGQSDDQHDASLALIDRLLHS